MRKLFITLSAGALALALAACGDAPTQPSLSSPVAARGGNVGGGIGDAGVEAALTVTSLSCQDTGGGGYYYNNTVCTAKVSGGAGGYTYDWDVIVTSQTDYAYGSSITGVCTDSYPVTFTVTDAAGATASKSDTFFCSAKSTGGGIEP